MATRRFVLVAFSVLTLAACRKAEVTSYRIPKEAAPTHPAVTAPAAATAAPSPAMPAATDPMMSSAAMTASLTAPGAPATALTWTAPANWKAKPASAMRRGSYDVPGEGGAVADLSIFVFPGAAGGLIDNVNRWRGQVGLAPLAAAKLADEIATIKSDGGLELAVVDMVGGPAAQRERILGAILNQGAESWFFKLKGSDELVAKEKPAFLAFLKTVKRQ